MNRRPLHFITREKEWELLQRLETIVNSSDFNPENTALLMVSPDYSATVAMHLAHAWSRNGEMLDIIPVEVPYPDEQHEEYREKFLKQFTNKSQYSKVICVEAGIIRGGNWRWLVDTLMEDFHYIRKNITLVALCENVNSKTKSDYVGEYYNDDEEELMFYFEKYNKHWPIR